MCFIIFVEVDVGLENTVGHSCVKFDFYFLGELVGEWNCKIKLRERKATNKS